MYTDSQHIKKMIQEGNAELISHEISERFANYLNEMKWNITGTALELLRDNYEEVKLCCISDSDLIELTRQILDEKNSKIIFLFTKNEPSLMCDFDVGICNIDYVYWKAPGIRYMFPGSIIDNKLTTNFKQLMIYDGADTLIIRN